MSRPDDDALPTDEDPGEPEDWEGSHSWNGDPSDFEGRRRHAHLVRRAIEMYTSGRSYRQIAREVGYSHQTVAHWIRKEITSIPKAAADELRTRETMTLDRLQHALMEPAMRGSTQAAREILHVMDRRARLLGLDAPRRIDLGAESIDLEAAARELIEAFQRGSGDDPMPDLPEIPAPGAHAGRSDAEEPQG